MSGSSENKASENKARYFAKALIAVAPWIISMYTLYWLEYGEIWTTATPYRDKISIVILLLGMSLSFFLYMRLFKREQK